MSTTADGRQIFSLRGGTRLAEFVMSTRFVDVIEGPLGSGKTVGLCLRLMRHAQEQHASPRDGLRKTRFAMVRNTHPDLKRTTIRTWLDCFPEHIYGRFNWGQALIHKISFNDVRTEVDFMALDKPEDVRRLRSGEYTGIAFNELSFIDKSLFDEATSRLRYPKAEDGGPTWRGVIADTNAPDEDHWFAMMTGQVDLPPGLTEDERAEYRWPEDWGYYQQPAALLEETDQHGRVIGYRVNPQAENIENLPADYYTKAIKGKSKAWLDSRMMVRVVLVVDGSPVWPMFRRETHVASQPLRPVEGHEVVIGVDFGRSAGAVFMQQIGNRVLVQHEVVWSNESTVESAASVKRFLTKHYPNCAYRGFGDPKGEDKGVNDGRTGYEIYAANGIVLSRPPGLKQNMISTRVDAVANLLNEMEDGRPRFVVSPLCRTLIVAMAGRYHNERDEQGDLRPGKDRYSHVADALQYASIGIGEGKRMIGLVHAGVMKPMKVWKGRGSMRRVSA